MHIYVLGSGIIGTTTAYYLAKRGFQVTVIDRQDKAAMETSFANAGQITPGYSSPWAAPGIPLKAIKWMLQKHSPLVIKPTLDPQQYRWMWHLLQNCNLQSYLINKERMTRMSEYSRHCFQQLRQETNIQYEQRQLGTIQLFRSQKQFDATAKDTKMLEKMGIPYQILDKQGILTYEPGLSDNIHEFVGAVRLPNDETGDCYLFCQNLTDIATHLGVNFRFNQQVNGFEYQNDQIKGVWINNELETADAYVVSLGSYCPELLKPIGIDAPIYPLKGFSLTIPIKNTEKAPRSTVLDDSFKVAVTRFDNRIRMGGMAMLNGFDLSLKQKYRETLNQVFNHLYPEAADLNQATFWTGLRPTTPDGTPIVGATRFPNLWLNSGHGTFGWTMGCGSAKYLADLISGEKPEIDTEGFALSRYQKR